MVRRRSIAAVVALAMLGSGVAVAAEPEDRLISYEAASGSFYTGLRATAVGLPQIGMHGTVGVAELGTAVRAYHDSGAYGRDVAAVAGAARAYLEQRLEQATAPATRSCRNRYRRHHVRGVRFRLYRRVRVCRRVTPPRLGGKPAIVLDIDETSLSNYAFLSGSNFSAFGLVPPAATGAAPALAPTVELYRLARQRGVAVFFITGRPEIARIPTESNLRAAGYDRWDGLSFKPSGVTTVAYKAGQRKLIEEKGFDIVVNLGDQESDLNGGYADRGFKLPNPFYFIGDE